MVAVDQTVNILPIYILVHGGCGPDSEYVPHLYILVYGGRGLTGVNTAVDKKKRIFIWFVNMILISLTSTFLFLLFSYGMLNCPQFLKLDLLNSTIDLVFTVHR